MIGRVREREDDRPLVELGHVETTRWSNALAEVLTPMIAVGLIASIAVTKSFVGVPLWA
jgi:hypothetical protein